MNDSMWRGIFEVVMENGDISEVSNNVVYAENLGNHNIQMNATKPSRQGIKAGHDDDFDGTNNWTLIDTVMSRTSLLNTVFGSDPSLDITYHPSSASSPIVDTGSNSASIQLSNEYVEHCLDAIRQTSGNIDIGAFEYKLESSPCSPAGLQIGE